MSIKAALLDAPAASGKGKYTGVIDELADESALTAFHVPTVTACDLPAGRYVWVPDKPGVSTPGGGEFIDEATIERRNRPSFDLAFAGLCGAVEASGVALPEETRRYCAYLGRRRARRRTKGGKS